MTWFTKITNEKTGFTLLETLIALSVVSVGIMAAFTLSLANLNTARDNYERILAANLAREGVELVRNIRDSNWLKMEANEDCDSAAPGLQLCDWDEDLNVSTSTIAYNATSTREIVDSVEGCFNNLGAGTCRIFRNANNFYDHNSTGDATNMARVIKILALCLNPASDAAISTNGNFTCAGAPNYKVGLRVTAHVYWVDGDQTHTTEVVEDMYNWRSYVD
jgi:prepilin-type N-terminal cleavage/methylation domain-containing protein